MKPWRIIALSRWISYTGGRVTVADLTRGLNAIRVVIDRQRDHYQVFGDQATDYVIGTDLRQEMGI